MSTSTHSTGNRWSPVTQTDNAAPPDALPFELTAAERSQAAIFACEVERARREANKREADKALARWADRQYRELNP